MKKLVSIILGLALLVLCGCGGQPSSVTQEPEQTWNDTLPCRVQGKEIEVELSALYFTEEEYEQGYETRVYAILMFPEEMSARDIRFTIKEDIKLMLTWYQSQNSNERDITTICDISREAGNYFQCGNKVMLSYIVQLEGRYPLCSGEKIDITFYLDNNGDRLHMEVGSDMLKKESELKRLEDWEWKD